MRELEIHIIQDNIKMGFTEAAANLDQNTFEYLFPLLHELMLQKLQQTYSTPDLKILKYDIVRLYDNKHIYKLDTKPNSLKNLGLYISDAEQPMYKLAKSYF